MATQTENLNEALISLITPVLTEAINTAIQRIERQRTRQIDDDIMGVDEACQFLGCAKSTLYIHCSKGVVPHFKRGRLFFSRKALQEYILTGTKDK